MPPARHLRLATTVAVLGLRHAAQAQDSATFQARVRARLRPHLMQDRSAVDHPAHNREAVGSTPTPAPTSTPAATS